MFLASDFEALVESGDLVKVVAIVMGCSVGMVAIIASAIARVANVRSREAARREIAAYVAEGSIDPDKGIALIKAGRSFCDDDEDEESA